ncbi:MAG: exopolysaccharide Pel transporter PelG, partial [Phycisphaerales bacterium]|nr:exopolysaccharide Pel transporter PelG [Phycisphaerales bacterium]
MAGIGFRLEEIMKKRTLSSVARAGLYAGIIAAGPWMISVGTLAGLSLFLRTKMEPLELDRFTSLITHCYALALIISGPFSLILTRFAADRFLESGRPKIFASFLCALAIIFPICGVVGALLFPFGTGDAISPLQKASALALLVFAAGIFTAGNYLTSMSCYRSVVASFVAGFGASYALAVVLVKSAGSDAA